MAIKNPRISVTLTPESRAALDALSKTTGISVSSFIGRVVHDAIPIVEATTRALKIARSQPQKAADILNEEVVRANLLLAQEQQNFADHIQVRKVRRKRRT